MVKLLDKKIQVNQYLKSSKLLKVTWQHLKLRKILKVAQAIKNSHDLMMTWLIKVASRIKLNTFFKVNTVVKRLSIEKTWFMITSGLNFQYC